MQVSPTARACRSRGPLTSKTDHFAVAPGTYVNGSSLPKRSGVPADVAVGAALAVRACERWMASSIICGVAVVGFFVPGVGAAITPWPVAVLLVVLVALWAAAGEAIEVKARALAAPAPIRVKIVLRGVIVF